MRTAERGLRTAHIVGWIEVLLLFENGSVDVACREVVLADQILVSPVSLEGVRRMAAL